MTTEQKITELKALFAERDAVDSRIAALIGGEAFEENKASEPPPAGNVKHPCCGSKQARHRKSCAAENAGRKTVAVECTDCPWAGEVAGHTDFAETKCPKCGFPIVSRGKAE